MKKIFLIAFVALLTQVSVAQIPKPLKDTYVNDFAGVLTKQQVTALNQNIYKIEQQAGVQVAIVLVNKIPGQYDIQDFAVLIGKKWHVGKNKKGLVYVAAIDEHKQRIEVARNLDDAFTGAKSLEILDAIKPSFRANDYNAGLETLIEKISANLQMAPKQASTSPARVRASGQASLPMQAVTKDDTGNFWIGFTFVAVVVIALIVYIRRRKRKAREMQNFYNSNSGTGSYNPGPGNPNQGYPNQGYPNQGYGNPGYQQQPDHTFRNVATGAILGAAAGYAARSIQDRLNDNHNNDRYDRDRDNSGNHLATPDTSSSDDNRPSNWGNWGGDSSGNDNSSYDSGFSDDSSSDSGSSDSNDSSSGATSDW